MTAFKNCFCVTVADSSYSIRPWLSSVNQWDNVAHIARMRGNRKVYRKVSIQVSRKGRPRIYGEEISLTAPPPPDEEKLRKITPSGGKTKWTLMQRWNDVIVRGKQGEEMFRHCFDIVKISITDENGSPIYKRPLWLMIAGKNRKKISNNQAYDSYGRRYDIEHFFRFGKQRLGLSSFQTCETLHEENWQWIGLLAYNMLYHARNPQSIHGKEGKLSESL